ncbi:hypothetical protein ASZ80_03218 [Vibrio cholerae]|nr:hypothetical protein ASZ80_03218 [Vibrio cholerae]APF58301.1 hypothetical protein ASZ81_03211 [Vibrio cholerae]APF73158.1 hypothetical protein ASZ79_03190 [Vibrio cholerae]
MVTAVVFWFSVMRCQPLRRALGDIGKYGRNRFSTRTCR